MTAADMAALVFPIAATALALLIVAVSACTGAALADSPGRPVRPQGTYRQPDWVAWGEEHGFGDWERYGHSFTTFQDDYGPLDEQPHPMSQFVVHDAARVEGYYEGHDFTSSVFADAYGTGVQVGGLLEQRLGMPKTKRMLAPLLREMEKRAEMDESGQDTVLLDRVRAIARLLDDGFTVSDIIAMLKAAPTSAVAIFALRNGVPVEYAAAVAN